jgi:hypothetical protein
MLHTGVGFNSVGLSGVLGDLIVDESDDIESDWSMEDFGEGNLVREIGRISVVVNWDDWSCQHFDL